MQDLYNLSLSPSLHPTSKSGEKMAAVLIKFERTLVFMLFVISIMRFVDSGFGGRVCREEFTSDHTPR